MMDDDPDYAHAISEGYVTFGSSSNLKKSVSRHWNPGFPVNEVGPELLNFAF